MIGSMRAPVEATGTRSRRTTGAALVALVVSVLPAFLLGGVAVLVRRDLGFSESALGAAISAFFLASGLAAVPGGRLAERLGGLRATAVGVAGSSLALAGVAVAARSWALLVAFLAVGGVANSITQPATNLALARAVPVARQGLAFGVKQTNGPVATFLAGISAPLVGITVGWRWAFALAAVGALAFFAVAPRPYHDPPSRHPPGGQAAGDAPTRAVVLLAVGAGAGTAAAASLMGFYVESAVAAGLSVGAAGWWFATGSVAGTAARVVWGWTADRPRGEAATLVLVLLLAGAFGFALLGTTTAWPVFLPATVAAFAAGWGWFGLLLFAVVQRSPSAPARATAAVIAGVSGGGIVGPPAFGLLVERQGYPVAWMAAAAALVVAAAFVAAGTRAGDRAVTAAP